MSTSKAQKVRISSVHWLGPASMQSVQDWDDYGMRKMNKVRIRFCLLDLQLHGSPHDLTAPPGMLGLAAHVRGRRRRGRGVVEEYPQLLRG